MSVQSLPETVQVPRPPGIWTVPGAFFLRLGFFPASAPGPPKLQPAIVVMNMTTHLAPPGAERILRWIMMGIVIWGSIHALGAWPFNHDARRPVVVLVCVAGFLGFWLTMLAARRRRLNRDIVSAERSRG